VRVCGKRGVEILIAKRTRIMSLVPKYDGGYWRGERGWKREGEKRRRPFVCVCMYVRTYQRDQCDDGDEDSKGDAIHNV
jgi:hypothetical protein